MNKLHKGIKNGLFYSFVLWALIILFLTGCFTPMPEDQIAPYIFMDKKRNNNALPDVYITNYCDYRA